MEDRTGQVQAVVAADVFSGDSEMGALMRAHDWSATPLGPAEGWPQSLRTAVSIVLNSRYPMFIFWGRQLVKLYNDGYRPILATKHPWALGRPGPEIWPEIWDTIGPMVEAVVERGEATWSDDLLLFMQRSGYPEEVYFTFSYSPIRDESGGIGGMFCACTETTERVLGERRLRTLRELAARASAAQTAEAACAVAAETLTYYAADLPFALLYLVEPAQQGARLAGAAGLEPGTLASPPLMDLAGTDRAPPAWPLARVVQTGQAELVENLAGRFGALPARPWAEPPDSALVLPVASPGQERPAAVLVAGISPRRALDEAYRGFLELVAGQVAAAVANARAYEQERRRAEALAELDRAKTAFFSNVSHEFRTPLTLLLGPLEQVLDSPPEAVLPPVRAQIELAHRNGLRLLRLVNTLLDFSRLEAGRVEASFEPTDLSTLTAELAGTFRPAVERAGPRLVVDCPTLPEPVYVDRHMWEQIVLNLLSNAFKHTFEGEIAVNLRPVGEQAELVVRDTGIGIPPEELPRVFERFHRVRVARSRTHEGTGIGLSLVQELVKLHGGSIRVESQVDQGTTVTVALPFGSDHLPAERLGTRRTLTSPTAAAEPYLNEALGWLNDGAAAAEGGGLAGSPLLESPRQALQHRRWAGSAQADSADGPAPRPRVLLADDNADMREYAGRLLADRYEVEAVADGEAALAAVRARLPDLVLTDVMMPGLDGFELLRALRADPATRDLPVIMLSARAGEEARVEGFEAGADDYLAKPFSARELLGRVGAAVALAAQRRETARLLRESRERFDQALDAARIVAWEWDPHADRVVTTPNFAEIYGLPSLESAEQSFALVHPDDRERHRATLEQVLAGGGSYQLEFRIIRPDTGQAVWLDERGRAVLDATGRVDKLTGLTLDISERKALELMQRDFIANVSHELRNPLSTIKGYAQLVRRRGLYDDRAIEAILSQTDQLGRLVEDLLEASQLEAGRLELMPKRVDLVTRVLADAEQAQATTQAHRVRVAAPDRPLEGWWDPDRLGQVLQNLLSNAIKYSPAGGDILVRVESAGPEALVSVRDNGIGLAPEVLPNLFGRFFRAGISSGTVQGLGLGLYISKELVEAHGGRIWAESAGPGRGSTFWFALPLNASSEGPGD
jgi:PAS domain S-box-containing protein